ncbi:MerR family transcriptional regulator, partial [Amycolatopsis mediterranei]
FELADIRTMLTARSAADRAAMAARQRERLRARIARAQAALELLEGDCRHDDLMACPHFQDLLGRQLERS